MDNPSHQILIYFSSSGREPFSDWLRKMRDREARRRIAQRLARLALGDFGDHKALGGSLFELRIHLGPGYRVYYGKDGEKVILLLCGGDKDAQARDIERARQYWSDYSTHR